MLDRLFFLFVLCVFTSVSNANDANWNCQQDKKTKEWVCVGTAESSVATKAAPVTPKPEYKLTEVESTKIPPTTQVEPTKTNTDAVSAQSDIRPEAKPNEKLFEAREQLQTPEKLVIQKIEPSATKPVRSSTVSEAPPPVLPASQKPVPAGNKPTTLTAGGDKRGWNCDNKGKDGSWNCQLVGVDPKGEVRVVETTGTGIGLLDPAFDGKEELVFNSLRDRFKHNPWGNCTIQLGSQKYFIADKQKREAANIDMDSNAAEVYDNEIGNYRGNVEMQRADQRASSSDANYDSVSEVMDLHGNVYYSDDEIALHTESANLKLAKDESRLRESMFISPATPLRGKASAVYRDSKELSRYKDVAYTSCEPGNQDWVVHASDFKMNKTTGDGSAKNAWVEFKGVPVFYSPYLSFPIDDRRKTGFLAPSFGRTQRGGFNFSVPFYWNIAPNYDATIRPRYYTNRGEGPLFAADFRYLTQKSKGLVSAEYLSSDTVNDRLNEKHPTQTRDRYLATFKNSTHFTKNLSANMDLNIVSDYLYFSDLGNALSFPNFSHVRSFADAAYVNKGISFTGIVENFQTIDPSLSKLGGRLKPYRRLPQLNLNFDHTFESIPAITGLENEYAYFQHSDSKVPDGHRFNIKPYVSFPLKSDSGYVTPKLSLQHTEYLLNDQAPGVSDSIGRTVPIGSIDSGLFIEKDINLFGNSYLHTLEPRLFYLYIPKVNQGDIPIFDTALYDFQFDSLFRENRYSGSDRIQDANQFSAALTTRLVDSETGLEKLKLNIGQIYYLQNREVTAPVIRVGRDFLDNAVQSNTFSPIVAELSSQVNKHLSIQTGLQWDARENEIVRGNASVQIVNDPGEVLNIGYTYRKSYLIRDALDEVTDADIDLFNYYRPLNDQLTRAGINGLRNDIPTLRSNDIIQTDVSLRWPVYDNWFLVGRWQYSMLYNQTQEAFIGFEKENCCWRFRVIGRRYISNLITANTVNNQTNSNTQSGIFFQLEFKGLTGIGEKLDSFFSQSIPGYIKKDY